MSLHEEHIRFIIKDLHYRGVVVDRLQDEIVDHVISAVEDRMDSGESFIDAYQFVISRFGDSDGLIQTQQETIQSENRNTKAMLRNYLTVALRNLTKQKFYAIVNVSGLAVGIAACLIIILYMTYELSFDKFHDDYSRIYRVNSEIKFGPNHFKLAVCPAPLADVLRREYPETEHSMRFLEQGSMLVRRKEDSFKETRVIFADSSLFTVFTIPLTEGSAATALTEPNTMIISRTAADRYFPGESPLGQILVVENKDSYKVTGVFSDLPENSHFRFDFILSLVSLEYNNDQNWLSNNFPTYVKLKPGANPDDLVAKFPAMVDKYAGPIARQALGGDFTMEKFRASGNKLDYTMMPITDIHLHSDLTGELGVNSDVSYIYLFGAVALFILLIACINFMNLSTARSANRAREVGVRKVMGSLRSHLVRQFLTESVLLSVFSFFLAVGLAWLSLPFFNNLLSLELRIPFGSPMLWVQLLIGSLVVGFLAGVYPAFFLSAFKPVNVLKGNVALGMKSGFIRSALVVFQFFISILLIIGTLALNDQLRFIQNKKIGFSKDQVISIKDTYALGNQIESFKTEVLKDSRIVSGTISSFLPVEGTSRNDNAHFPEGVQPTQENLVSVQCWRVDYDYIRTLGMNIIQGRDFSREFPSDSDAVILNQAALQIFNYQGDVIGRKISTWSGPPAAEGQPAPTISYPIIGVVEDFHFESLRQNITPVALFLRKSDGRVSFRFQSKDVGEVIASVESAWKKMAPGMPFNYSFLDEDFGKMYATEQRNGAMLTVFAVLAIIIATLGLFALTSFTAEQRTKEIGIRKVLGASVGNIMLLLSREFGKLILIAFLLAIPIAWYGIGSWLESYYYHTSIGPLTYLVAGLLAFAVAWLTMSFQSFKAAIANPVKSLRSE